MARSLLGRKTRGGGGAGTGAGRAGRAGMFPPSRGRRIRAGNCVPAGAAIRAQVIGRLPAAAGGAAARGPRACGARAQGPATPAGARARRCPHARAAAASAAPAPRSASAAAAAVAAGGRQDPGRSRRRRDRAARPPLRWGRRGVAGRAGEEAPAPRRAARGVSSPG